MFLLRNKKYNFLVPTLIWGRNLGSIGMVGSIGMDHVFFINELCYKGTLLQRNYRKMTITWSFSYHNSFVKVCGKNIGS